ncbi:MAG: hypothetical protein ACO3BG_04950 [Candidatus Nanopelagicales bacterium]
MFKKFLILILAISVLSSCSTDDNSASQNQNGQQQQNCELNASVERKMEKPFGVLMPSGDFRSQSYKDPQEMIDLGFNAVSLAYSFYFTSEGKIVFGRSERDTKDSWLNSIKCNIVKAKNSGLMTLTWGQFEQADLAQGQEPMGVPQNLRETLTVQAIELMPEIAQLMEDLKVEYWSPVSELDKYMGYEIHNKYFPDMIEAGKSFTGITYAQPMTLSLPPSFFTEKVAPNLGEAKAMSISWISFGCAEDDMQKAEWVVDQVKKQGINEIFIGEIGGTRNKKDEDLDCFNTFVNKFNGKDFGVLVLDLPDGFKDGSQVKGTWQEQAIRELVSK